MRKRLLSCLASLMMVAIPAQGFAAATMVYCGPAHERTAVFAEAAPPAGNANVFIHGDSGAHTFSLGHMHEHGPSVTQMEVAVGGEISADETVASDQFPIVKCSVCAMCCSAGVITSSPLAIHPLDFSAAAIPAVSESPISFVTDGPRRPPRSFLA